MVRHQLLRLGVLILELRRISVGKGLSYFPIEISRLADPGLSADLRHRHAVVAPSRMSAF
jgi:hypothetical protein